MEKINRLAYFKLGDLYDSRHPSVGDAKDGDGGDERHVDASNQVDPAEQGNEEVVDDE